VLAHIHPSPSWFTCGARPIFNGAATPGSASGSAPRPARCPEALCLVKVLPLPGWHPAPPRRALPLLRRSYGLMRQTKSLPPPTALALVGGSLQVAASPCWVMALPDVISGCLSLDARAPIAVVCEVLIPVSSPTSSAFPAVSSGRLFHGYHSTTSEWRMFRDCSHSVMFGPPSLLAIQVVPTSREYIPRAAMASTSEQNIRRYRRMHRIC
jgi:hypothetical protein